MTKDVVIGFSVDDEELAQKVATIHQDENVVYINFEHFEVTISMVDLIDFIKSELIL